MAKQKEYFDSAAEEFDQFVKNTDSFLSGNEAVAAKIKTTLKNTYDFCKSEEIRSRKSNALPELIIKKFDLEQIWQQIELQNDDVLAASLPDVSKLVVGKDGLVFKNLQDKIGGSEEDTDDNAEEEEEEANEVASVSGCSDDDSIDLNDRNSDEEPVVNELHMAPRKKRSEIEDDFLNLDEMENFLKSEEKKLQDPDSGNDSEEESEEAEEEDVDLFKAESDDDEKVKTARFKDFFMANDAEKGPKRNAFLQDLSDEEESTGGNAETEPSPARDEAKSTLELRQQRLDKRIEAIEKAAVGEKPWQLKGEITADGRPQNSLLEEIVDFDLTSRPAPVITENTTLQLEDIIRQRIKDKVFDSVERKARPVETPLEYKKKLVLDQEKSKQSLAQIYEKEFVEQRERLDPENQDKEPAEPELHKEIKTLMRGLFNKLDALSNFHFTPKPAVPELRIVSNLPAISMEEVAPVAANDGALLAPEEVRPKTKGDIKGKSERDATDKNRERRKKKQKQRAHLKEKQKRESLVEKMKPGLGNKYSKEKAKKLLEQVTKDGNIDKMDESGAKKVKSSKAFFTQLQEEVQTHIGSKVKKTNSKKKAKKFEAKKLKL